jgi:hypothetical protein
MNSDGAKMPPEPPDAHRHAGREDLAEGEDDQEPDRVVAGGGLEHDRVVTDRKYIALRI